MPGSDFAVQFSGLILPAFFVLVSIETPMNRQIPALVTTHAAVFAVVIFTLMQTAQPPTVIPIACPPHIKPPSKETAESGSTADAPIHLDFSLPK